MTPHELAERHPRLFHLTEPDSLAAITRWGLLPTGELLKRCAVPVAERRRLTSTRRPAAVELEHEEVGRVVINDNLPLSEKALLKCLDDGMSPSDWLRLLNGMVFFWPSEQTLQRLLNARINRERTRRILVFNTLSLATAHWKKVHLSPINSGSTIRKPARRGRNTFSPAANYSYREWQKLRGGRDTIVEVTIRGPVDDVMEHLVETYTS